MNLNTCKPSITKLPMEKAIPIVLASRLNRESRFPLMAHWQPEDILSAKPARMEVDDAESPNLPMRQPIA